MSSSFQKLPKHLLGNAFNARFAWSRADALEVIKWADAHNLSVIGAEVRVRLT